MAKRGILEHPKTIELASRLELPECYALGILEAFWHHVARYFPEGEITGLKPSVLARSIRYPGDAAGLWALLSECGFLDVGADGRAIVHDWSEHADNAVHQLLKKRGTRFADGRAPFSRAVPVEDPSSQTVCEPLVNHSQQVTNGSRSFTNDSCLPEPEPKPEPSTLTTSGGKRQKNGAAPPSEHSEIYHEFLRTIGHETDGQGPKNNGALKKLLRAGYARGDIIDCTQFLTRDPFYATRAQPISLVDVGQCIEKWVKNGRPEMSPRAVKHLNGAAVKETPQEQRDRILRELADADQARRD